MSEHRIADKFISPGGRLPEYSHEDLINDMLEIGLFLAWAEHDHAQFGGVVAKDALIAFCRIADVSAVGLRNAIMQTG